MSNEKSIKTHKILILLTYFGHWPNWTPAFFHSCVCNDWIDWLFTTDCQIPAAEFSNITFRNMSLDEFNDFISQKLGFQVQKGPYAQLDYRPAYGFIFSKELERYDFWGHCDLDVIFGNIKNLLTEDYLECYDIISSRKDFLAGHFKLWRNKTEINTLYSRVPGYRQIFANPQHQNFDEDIMSANLHALLDGQHEEYKPRVLWSKKVVIGWPELARYSQRWHWVRGKLYDEQQQEHIYIHFMKWKRTMKCHDIGIGDDPPEFWLTRRGIWTKSRSWWDWLLDTVPLDLYLSKSLRQTMNTLGNLKKFMTGLLI